MKKKKRMHKHFKLKIMPVVRDSLARFRTTSFLQRDLISAWIMLTL